MRAAVNDVCQYVCRPFSKMLLYCDTNYVGHRGARVAAQLRQAAGSTFPAHSFSCLPARPFAPRRFTPSTIHTSPIHTSPIHTSPIHTSPIHTSPIHTSPIDTLAQHSSRVHTSPVRKPPNSQVARDAGIAPEHLHAFRLCARLVALWRQTEIFQDPRTCADRPN